MTALRRVVAGAWVAGLGLLCASAAAVHALDETTVPVPVASAEPESPPGWSLLLAEDFDRVDPRTWTLKDDTYSGNEDSYLSASNCSIDRAGADGHALRLQGRQESVRRWGGSWDYTSCYATTEGKFSVPDYFRAEVRARVPMEQGMWAAPLWFRPADGSDGEIDLVETLGSEAARPKVHQTIHTGYGSNHEQAGFTHPFAALGDAAGTGWHTYTIEKVPGRITMWVDGVQTARWSTTDPDWYPRYYEAGKRWDLRINLQIGGDWGGPPDATTDWSAGRTAMVVDRVHVWTPTALALLGAP